MSNLFDNLSGKIQHLSSRVVKDSKKYIKSAVSKGEEIGYKGKIQIEIEKKMIGRYFPITVGINADAATAIDQIFKELKRQKSTEKIKNWTNLYLKDKKEFKAEDILKCLSQNEDYGFDDLNYSISDGNVVKLDKVINQLYLEGINPVALLRSVSKHFQKILFINQKLDSGMNLSESLTQLKPPIFFLYINQFKEQVKKWKTTLCYKVIERILETEEICKMNSKIAKIICCLLYTSPSPRD